MNCRICGSDDYASILDMGAIYPSNFIDNGPGVKPKPLHLVKCSYCSLVQLRETFDLDLMYREHYWYRSALNKSMVGSLKDVVDSALKRVTLNKGDAVLDIGCNDGTLLSFYDLRPWNKVGFDPSRNVVPQGVTDDFIFINDYFHVPTKDSNLTHKSKKGDIPVPIHAFGDGFKIITAIAMFYDLEDPNKFLIDVKSVLADDGILIIQFTDLLSMLRLNAFDNICHEHLEYYSLQVLNYLLEKHGLNIFDVEYNEVNGGSVRVYAQKSMLRKREPAVDMFMSDEKVVLEKLPIEKFGIRILRRKAELLKLISEIKDADKTVYVLGASTKGNTLLQHYGLDSTIIDKALEINEDKFGKHTIGTNIPIISEEEGMKDNPDYLLVLPWHFKDFFVAKFETYLTNGGKLIFPLPEVMIV